METLPADLQLEADIVQVALESTPPGVLQRLARHFSLYSVGAGVSFACSLAILPVYAIGFSANDFGLLATAQIVGLAIVTLFRLGIPIGMFRYVAVQFADGDGRSADSTIVSCFGATGAVAVVVTAIGCAALALVPTSGLVRAVGLLILLNLSVSVPREIAEFVLRAQQRAAGYVLLTSAFLVLTTLLTAILVLAFRWGVIGVFAATLAANVVTAVAAVGILMSHLKPRLWSREVLWRAIRFGAPSVPALLADWVTQYSDRFFLTVFAGLGQVGVYSMAYRIGLIEQQVLGTAAQGAWDPFLLSTYRRPDAPRMLGRVATYLGAIGVALVLLLSTAAPGLFTVMHARAEYFGGLVLIFLIALANLFGLFQYLFLAPTSVKLKPELGLAIRVGAAVLNIALNFALISRYGMTGAAWATLITFLTAAIVTELVCRRLWRIEFAYGKLLLILIGGVVIQTAIILGQSMWMYVPLVAQPLIAVAAYGLWLLAIGVITRDAIGESFNQLRRLSRFRESAT